MEVSNPVGHQDRLLKSLAPALTQYGDMTDWRIDESPVRSRKCIIHRFTGPEDAPIIAVKEYRNNVVKSNAAITQFNALLAVADQAHLDDPESDYFVPIESISPTSGIAASKPIAFLPRFDAIAMEWVDAPSLMSKLTQSKGADLARPILETARWIRGFHDLSTITTEIMDTSLMMERLTTRLDASPKYSSSKPISEALSEIDRLSKQTMTAPHAVLHGDFTPSNILIGPEATIGIDIWARRRAPVYEDVARMLTYLSSTGTGMLGSKPVVQNYEQTCKGYLAAYGYSNDNIASDAFRFVLLYQLLRRWITAADWMRYRQPPLRARHKRRRLEVSLQTILHQ